MADPIRGRGFVCPVTAVEDTTPQLQVGSMTVRLEGEGVDRHLALTIRHADGTTLMAYLSDHSMGRLGDALVDIYGTPLVTAAVTAHGTVQ
jgi:hypothetical protein